MAVGLTGTPGIHASQTRVAHAAPPTAGTPGTSPEPSKSGYLLSACFEGPEPARAAAMIALSAGIDVAELGGGRPPERGELVGRVQSLENALTWVLEWSFPQALGQSDDPLALRVLPAPPPGLALYESHGHVIVSLSIDAHSADGARRVHWPASLAPWLPADRMLADAHAVSRVPVYATPSAVLPPIAERVAVIGPASQVWSLGIVDRCDTLASPRGETRRQCLRWRQILAHTQGEFVAGYVPAWSLALEASARTSAGASTRAQVQPAALIGDVAWTFVIAEVGSSVLMRAVETAGAGERYPEIEVIATDTLLRVLVPDGSTQVYAVAPGLPPTSAPALPGEGSPPEPSADPAPLPGR